MNTGQRLLSTGAIFVAAALASPGSLPAGPSADKELARQIFETMLKAPGVQPAQRPVHAKGLVCQGTFEPSKEAVDLSTAAHFRAGAAVPVTARFSDGASDPSTPDNSPNAGPRGLAVRFSPPGGGETDIVAISHNGFVVGTGEEFLALQKAIVATDPHAPHPWPVEQFLGAHPRALKFVQDNRVLPASFATESFFANDALVFVDKAGRRRAGRYQVRPVAGPRHLGDEEAKGKPAGFLFDDLKERLAAGPVRFRLVLQLAGPGDPTKDPSLVWPDDRQTVDLGVIEIKSALADSAAEEKRLAFDPVNLTDGIELSDDPLPALRSRVYALSARHRHAG